MSKHVNDTIGESSNANGRDENLISIDDPSATESLPSRNEK